MGDIIKESDLFAPDLTAETKRSVDELNASLRETVGTIKQMQSVQRSIAKNPIQNSSDINQHKKDIAEKMALENKLMAQRMRQAKIIDDEAKRQIAAERVLKKAVEDEAKEIQKNAKANEKANSVYQQMVKRLSEVKKELKELSVTGVTTGEKLTGLRKEFVELDEKVRTAEESTGEFQRNVGNYPNHLSAYGKGLKAVGGLLGLFGKMVGINTDALAEGVETFKEAGKALKEYHHATEAAEIATEGHAAAEEAHTVASETSAAATEETTIAEKALNLVRTISLPVIGWVVAGAAALAAGYYYLVKPTNDSAEAQAKLNSEIERGNRLMKISNESHVKIAENELELDRAMGASKEKLLADEMKVLLKKETARQTDLQNTEANLTALRNQVKHAEDVGTHEDEVKAREALNKELDHYAELKEAGNEYHHAVLVLQAEFDTEEREQRKKKREQDAKDAEDDAKKRLDAYNQSADELNRIIDADEARKLKNKQVTAQTEKEIEILQKQNELDVVQFEKAKAEKKYAVYKKELMAEFELKEQLLRMEADLEIQNEKNSTDTQTIKAEKIKKIEQKHFLDLQKLGREYEQSVAEADARELERKRQQRQEELNTTIDFTEQSLQRKDELQEKQLDNDLDMRQRNILQQQQLAEQGRANTLAFEKAAAAKDEKEKQELAIKQEKREKAIAFLKLFAAYADKGEPDQALSKTLIQMAIAGAIAGSYIEGTENVADDLKGNKMHNGQDGYVIAVDGRERILNPDQNAMIGDMSNDALAKLARDYQDGYLPAYITNGNTGSLAENMTNALMLREITSLNAEIKEIKQVLRDRPVSEIHIDKDGNVTRRELRNGLARVSMQKNNSPLNYI